MDNERSLSDNLPGVYRDPKSGKTVEVTRGAAADALVHMEWERVPAEAEKPKPKVSKLPDSVNIN